MGLTAGPGDGQVGAQLIPEPELAARPGQQQVKRSACCCPVPHRGAEGPTLIQPERQAGTRPQEDRKLPVTAGCNGHVLRNSLPFG